MIRTKMVAFYNWTDKEFTCEYDKENYTFESHSTYSVPEEQAKHFAKHLTQLYMNTHDMEVFTIEPMSENFKKIFSKSLPIQKVVQPFEKIDNHYEKVANTPKVEEPVETEAPAKEEVTEVENVEPVQTEMPKKRQSLKKLQ